MNNSPSTLYLHGGPGLNASVERAWFGENLPVLWWDQPRFAADAQNAFDALLEATSKQLTHLFRLSGKPVKLLAWSFGARLGLELANRHPEQIDSTTLLAPTFCLETAFLRLATRLSLLEIGGKSLATAIADHGKQGSHETFLAVAMELLAIPDLLKHYWTPGDEILYTRHLAEAAKTGWFDLPTFIAVSRDLFDHRRPKPTRSGIHHLRILAGRHDPYFDPESDIEHWKRLFPQASIRIVNSGHMIPFEIPAAEWLSSVPPSAFLP